MYWEDSKRLSLNQIFIVTQCAHVNKNYLFKNTYLAGINPALLKSSAEHACGDLVVIVIWGVTHSVTNDRNTGFL